MFINNIFERGKQFRIINQFSRSPEKKAFFIKVIEKFLPHFKDTPDIFFFFIEFALCSWKAYDQLVNYPLDTQAICPLYVLMMNDGTETRLP